ncbi:MAG: hypothetical protein LBE85_11335 [Candidatus Accumulibacter sp.]|jgi:hypothetical protein|nr:hypothetical protein [Accumulibacter sp.]
MQTRNAELRREVLETLYRAREECPSNGWVKIHDLTQAHGPVDFALAILSELGQIKRSGFSAQITGAGVIACEDCE